MVQEWIAYIDRLDKLLEKAVKMCVVNTLETIYKSLHGDGSMAPSPIFKLEIDLINNKLDFTPKVQDLADFLGNIFNIIINSVKSILQLVEKFRLPRKEGARKLYEKIQTKRECNTLNEKINKEIRVNQKLLSRYLEVWVPFRPQWELNKDSYMSKYEEAETDPSYFDLNIGKYTEIGNKVSIQESSTTVHFCVVQSAKLKYSILSHIDDWQCRHTELLKKKAYAKLLGKKIIRVLFKNF